ncbi:MAG: hypothetical protein LBH41_01230, partial [Rickettsiales bacterium]|nr:hypothetical protein [Rickettsiales bacterium]
PDAAPAAKGGLSVSIGVASYPFSGDDVDSLLDAAKEAADRSKAAGGGRITYHKLFTEVEQENL